MSLVGLDQPEPDKPRDSVALHFDGTSEDGEALCAMFGNRVGSASGRASALATNTYAHDAAGGVTHGTKSSPR